MSFGPLEQKLKEQAQLTLKTNTMKIKKNSWVWMLLAVILGCTEAPKQQTINEMQTEVIPVKVEAIKTSNASQIMEATGLLTTENEARYAFLIGGIIQKIYVKEGDSFTKGQLLASLNTTEIEAQYQQVLLNLEKAKRDYTRTQNMFRDSVATLEQFQNARTGVEIAQKTVDAVLFNKKNAQIYAQNDGFVTLKLSNPGEVVAAGAPVLAIHEKNTNQSWVLKLGVTDKFWKHITLHQNAVVEIDAFEHKKFEGKVSKKAMSADPTNGTYTIEIKLLNPTEKLAVGMFAKAVFTTENTSNYSIVPYDALLEAEGKRAFVFVPNNNKVKRVPITIESFNNEYVVVKEGLEDYTSVITSNSAFLNENSTVKIVKN